MEKLKIMVVDDEARMRKLVKKKMVKIRIEKRREQSGVL